MDIDIAFEIIAVLLALGYLYYMVKENILCWIFGIANSLLSLVLMIRVGLYSESILYVFYVGVGIYGLLLWSKKDKKGKEIAITNNKPLHNVMLIIIGAAGALGLGHLFSTQTNAESPYFDATTTSFSFVASFLEAHKILSSWIYWILINGATIYLYFTKGLFYYTGLTVVYTVFSVAGLLAWRKKYLASKVDSANTFIERN
ncbi:MAG: nicotinamide riboside transporter PnuC [Schleiferiaceae bacterium]